MEDKLKKRLCSLGFSDLCILAEMLDIKFEGKGSYTGTRTIAKFILSQLSENEILILCRLCGIAE